MKLGIIGLGNMGSAMLTGILKKGLVKPEEVLGAEPDEKRRQEIEKSLSIRVTGENKEVAAYADILILAVKPQVYETVLKDIRKTLPKETVVISIAPGKTLAWLTKELGGEIKLVRCMPNTPALVMEGCTGVCRNSAVSDEEFTRVLELLNCFGKAYEVSEKMMDAVVAVSGSSPAYVFMLIEAMADAAVAEGMPRQSAYSFAAQAVYGSAKMVLETGKHPGELKDMVCSPGGTTIEAVQVLEECGFRSAIIEAMRACAARSREL
ncbi:MAG: pyrroline-5-carboxylate reductase [Lachnospiraceae bacterium]|nr:pyrroline-5-carboxylate reductase [Lachnospiraceae bacterium]